MYNDQVILKQELENKIKNHFGEKLHKDVVLLIEKLQGKDTYINNNLVLNLQNILALDVQKANFFIKLAHELVPTSAFAPVLLLEKIPTLTFYGISEEVAEFLLNIKNYGSRAISLFLGSDLLKTEDLIDILEQTTLSFYKALLAALKVRHNEFGVCTAIIMRAAAKIESFINQQEIEAYLDICSIMLVKYGVKITEQYLRNADEFNNYVPCTTILKTLDKLAQKNLVLVEFAVSHPTKYFTNSSDAPIKINSSHLTDADANSIKLNLLKKQDYNTFFENPCLFEDKDFLSLVLSWPTLNKPIKANILFQLEQNNFKQHILNTDSIAEERNIVNQATNTNWLNSWMFCEEIIDLSFIRKQLGQLLQNPKLFSIESKSIVKNHNTIFDRSNPVYDSERIGNMIETLLNYCIDVPTKTKLRSMKDFITGNTNALRNLLSTNGLVIQVWERNPWKDYGRSDELFSCTSLGDYNAGNAPGFLADLNLNNLDIYSNEARVGRIHLCLIKDSQNKNLLLLDCVDGTERIISGKKKFSLIMDAILAYARYIGVEQIKVNYDVDYNTTPKKFIAYLEQTFKQSHTIEFYSRLLPISTTRKLIPYPCHTFLESFIKGSGAFIRGALISIKSH